MKIINSINACLEGNLEIEAMEARVEFLSLSGLSGAEAGNTCDDYTECDDKSGCDDTGGSGTCDSFCDGLASCGHDN